MKRILLCIAISISGCAGPNYRPMIDTVGVDMNGYEADLRACQAYADQVSGAANQALIGAGIGAALSLGLAVIGGGGYSRSRSAGAGALLGGVGGAASGETDQHNVIRRCLAGRGYRVLQ